MFIDEAEIEVKAGKGGDGSASFRREKFVPKGGPDGGDGGDGGHVYLRVKENIHGLANAVATRVFRAENGEPGRGKQQYGAKGESVTIDVPPGTIVYELADQGEQFVVDLGEYEGDTYLIARGGKGGLGNLHFKSSTNRAPRETTKGTPGEHKRLKLVVKHLADIGLVGLPNAGKSTFLSVISRAKPQIAEYPFTTLEPHLGIVEIGDERLVVADIPGLIEGAAAGKGLGHKFLKHLARTRVLIHLVDAGSDDVAGDYKTIRAELGAFDQALLDRPEIVVLSKSETVSHDKLSAKQAELGAVADESVLALSAATHKGIEPVLQEAVRRANA